MKRNLTLKTLSLAIALLFVGLPRLVIGQETSELEKLKATVKTMEQTIQEMNRKIAEMEKQKARPEPAVTGVPPPTHPGAMPTLKAEPPKEDLADATTKIPYQETMNEESLGAPRPGNAPLDPTYQGFMQLFGTKTWIRLGGYAKLDTIADSTKVGNPNMFITSKIPVQGEPDFGKDGRFALHAKQTRLNLELRSPTPLGSLKIYYENENRHISISWGNRKLKAYVSAKTLDGLEGSGGSDIAIEGNFKTDKLNLEVSGGSDFDGKLELNDLAAHASGGSDIDVSGSAKTIHIEASGGSDFKGSDFVVENCTIDASGGSDVYITVNKELSVDASGGSDVHYKGTGLIREIKNSGGGSVKKISK